MPRHSDDDLYAPPRQGLLSVVSNRPFVMRQARLPLAVDIPTRQWLYGTYLLRGFVTVLVAPGGTGKSLLAMAICASIALGRKLYGQHVFEQCNAAYVNLEDPMDELERRLAALQMRFGIRSEDLINRMWMNSGDDRELTIARVADDGSEIIYPDVSALISEINEHKIGVLAVDPYAESHELEENSNPQMIRASKAWRTVARATNCAILLVHHVRKGIATDIDAARGAKALTDSARVGLMMAPMSDKDAEEVGIEKSEASRYVRLDNAKANMSARASKASWYHLDDISLGNSSTLHPHGDQVAVLVGWRPGSLMGNLTAVQCNAALDAIAKGPRAGVLYCLTRKGRGNNRWAGLVLQELFGLNEAISGRIVSAWVAGGVLIEKDYHDGEQRKDRLGLFVVDAKRPVDTRPTAPDPDLEVDA